MSITIDKDLKQVYLDITSDAFMKAVFVRSQILERDKDRIVIEAKYNKSYLQDYQHIMDLCFNVNDIILNVIKTINPCEDRFYVSYFVNIKNYQDFSFIPFLDTIRALVVAEFKSCDENKVECNIIYTEVGNNINEKDIDFTQTCKREFVYDVTKDFFMNFLNMLVINRIQYAYMKKVRKYYRLK
jgi:hypothetical protein